MSDLGAAGSNRWMAKRVFILGGWTLIGVGCVMWPLPIPLGIPMIAVGTVVLLRHSMVSRRLFARLRRRYPQMLDPVRNYLRKRKRQDAP